jgi:hypothetical protein
MSSKRDYEIAAAALGEVLLRCNSDRSILSTEKRKAAERDVIVRVAEQMSLRYALDSPAFDKTKFLEIIAKKGGLIK